nr:hypothetical protein [Lachnospiraceae bacterium]
VSSTEEKTGPEEQGKPAIEVRDDKKPFEEEEKAAGLGEEKERPLENDRKPAIGEEEKKNPYLEEQIKALTEPEEEKKNPYLEEQIKAFMEPEEEKKNPYLEEQIKALTEPRKKNPVIEEKKGFEREPSSFVGYSENQLKELYYEDKISRNEYNQELESREEQREFLRASNEAMAKDMLKGLRDEEALQVTKQEMKIVFSNEPLNGILPEERVKIIDSLENITLAGEASVPTRG